VGVKPPYTRAMTPHTRAKSIAWFSMVLLPFYGFECESSKALDLEFPRGLLLHRDVLQATVSRQPVLEGGKGLAADERREVVAAFGRDVEAVGGDEVARNLLFHVRDVAELRHAALPSIRLAGSA